MSEKKLSEGTRHNINYSKQQNLAGLGNQYNLPLASRSDVFNQEIYVMVIVHHLSVVLCTTRHTWDVQKEACIALLKEPAGSHFSDSYLVPYLDSEAAYWYGIHILKNARNK